MAVMDRTIRPLDREGRAQLVRRAVAEREAGAGRLPARRLHEYSSAAQVSVRTFQRWMSGGAPARREHDTWTPSEADIVLYGECLGNVARVRDRMLRDPLRSGVVPSGATLRRAYAHALTPAERAYLKKGHKGWRDHVLYVPMRAPHRNYEWQVDHKKLELLVRLDARSKPVKMWLTTFMDSCTRAIMGWALCPNPAPSQAEIYAAMRSALRVDPARGPFGGVPLSMRWDNGMDFLADAISQTALALDCRVIVCDAYTPEQKGKIERLHRTVKEELLAELPFYTAGPRNKAGRLYGPGSGPISYELLLELVDSWVLSYNTERRHRALDDQTPLEVWENDIEPLRTLPDQDLHWLLLKRATRKVTREGVSFPRVGWFVAPEIGGLVGEHVEIRWTPGDERTLEIFYQDKHLCTAVPRDQVPSEDEDQVRANRIEDKKHAVQVRRRTSRRQAERFGPLTAAGQKAEVTTVITLSQARGEGALRGGRTLKHAAKQSLLGSGGYEVDAPVDTGRDSGPSQDERKEAS